MPVDTITWKNNKIRLIDQTRLPEELIYIDIEDIETLGGAIKSLKVRGAPAIGIAAGLGIALAAHNYSGTESKELFDIVHETSDYLRTTRPTAVNLFWALDRMENVVQEYSHKPVTELKKIILNEALSILDEDKRICRKIGKNGARLLPDTATVLTHCNAGGLATADYGTALGVIYAAVQMGKQIKVYADETRPLLQGSRLTAWELQQSGVEVTVLCDSAAGFLMQQKRIDYVITGADRIAANGDTANKIGTYPLAVLAVQHNIPFYIAAPVSTFDFFLKSGSQIPVEQRSPEEVIQGFGKLTGPPGVDVYNPAFDVTPHNFITGYITEKGIFQAEELERNLGDGGSY
ncbi:MAG: S-methyl-5-thioribose-1-phosphate isomerase [bacterium]